MEYGQQNLLICVFRTRLYVLLLACFTFSLVSVCAGGECLDWCGGQTGAPGVLPASVVRMGQQQQQQKQMHHVVPICFPATKSPYL